MGEHKAVAHTAIKRLLASLGPGERRVRESESFRPALACFPIGQRESGALERERTDSRASPFSYSARPTEPVQGTHEAREQATDRQSTAKPASPPPRTSDLLADVFRPSYKSLFILSNSQLYSSYYYAIYSFFFVSETRRRFALQKTRPDPIAPLKPYPLFIHPPS